MAPLFDPRPDAVNPQTVLPQLGSCKIQLRKCAGVSLGTQREALRLGTPGSAPPDNHARVWTCKAAHIALSASELNKKCVLL